MPVSQRLAVGEVLKRGEKGRVLDFLDQGILDRVGERVEQLLFRDPVVEAMLGAKGRGEERSLAVPLLVDLPCDEAGGELKEL